MSTLGKVLAVLNVLAALALGALIAMDYGKRESWAYSVFRYDLAIQGLPLNKEETGPDGRPAVNLLGKQTQQELFAQAGGQPVLTQVDEVAAVEQRVQAKIQEAGEDKPKQIVAYARFLTPLATSNAQREEYLACQKHLADADAMNKLKTQLDAAFSWAVEIVRRDKRQRTFPEAFEEGLRYVRGEPTRPFSRAMVKALAREPDKVPQVFQNALRALRPDAPPQQVAAAQLQILQGLRGDAGNQRPQLIEAAFADALESVRADYAEQLKSAFEAAKTGQRKLAAADGTTSTKKDDPEEQRQAIAHVLFAMLGPLAEEGAAGEEAKADLSQTPAFRRFLVVVGLEHGVREINQAAQTLARITYELENEMERDLSDFADAQQELLTVVQDQASRYEVRRAMLEHKRNQLATQQELVRKRQAEITRLEGEIATARQATVAQREELKKMSQGLFDLRLQLRDATTKNQELEKKLRELEGVR
jgi:hypothetical protein